MICVQIVLATIGTVWCAIDGNYTAALFALALLITTLHLNRVQG